MKKMTLKIDSLRVESFAVGAMERQSGTVHGYERLSGMFTDGCHSYLEPCFSEQAGCRML
jgi:hypothetical protein